VVCASKQSQIEQNTPVFYNLFQFQIPLDKLSLWILSKDFLARAGTTVYWLLLTSSVDLLILFPCLILSRLPRWLAFFDNVYKLHGSPEKIISDRDKIFNSQFWQQLFSLTGTELSMSSSYHPQTDGQTERVNQCLEAYLRCFTHACPTKWM
jgi:transposase InsO family protein